MEELAKLGDKSIAELTAIYLDNKSESTRDSINTSLSTDSLGIKDVSNFADLKDKINSGIDDINSKADDLMSKSEKHKKEAEKLQGNINNIVDFKV